MSLLQRKDRSLTRVVAGMAPVTLSVQALSFLSSLALAAILGATYVTDAYYLALSVPVLVYGILLAALRLGAIPALTEADSDEGRDFNAACSELVVGVLVATVGLSLVATSITVALMPLLVGGAQDPRILPLARLVTLELAPLGVLGALVGTLGAILTVRHRPAAPVAVMGFEPLVKTALILLVGRELGAHALAIGNVVGSTMAAVVLWRLLARQGVRLRVARRLTSPFVRGVLRSSVPILVGQTVLQVNPPVDRAMASALGPGSVTELELGLRIFAVPVSLMAGTLIAPVVARWSARYAAGGWPALTESLLGAARAIFLVVPPVVVLGFVLRQEVITALYRSGAYSAAAAHDTAGVFGMLILGLPAQVFVVVFASLFIVLREPIVLMVIAFANVALNVLLNLLLRPVYGVAGIALSTTLTYTVLCLLYALAARRSFGILGLSKLRLTALRAVPSAVAVALVALAIARALPPATNRLSALLTLASATTAGLAVHLLFARLASDQAMVDVLVAVRRRNDRA